MILLAIDPGKKQGWAVFVDGLLVACGKGLEPKRPVDRVVIELPESRGGHTNTPVDSLIALAIEAGAAAGRAQVNGSEIVWAKASAWKGQTPKQICHVRALAKLDAKERAIVDASNATGDTLDAVALGLWALTR